MKRLYFAAALFAVLPGMLCAGVIDFAKLASTAFYLPLQEKGQAAEPAVIAGRKALRLEWNCAEARWCSVILQPGITLPPFKQADFTLTFFREADSTVRRASLLLADRDNETFQLVAELPPATGKWQAVKFSFDPKSPKANIWGGKKKNRIPDFPMRIQGVTCSYAAAHGIDSAALGVLEWKITPVPSAAKTLPSTPGTELVDFGKLMSSEINLPNQEQGQTGERRSAGGRDALQVRWENAKAPACSVTLRPRIMLPVFDRAQFSLELFREADSPVRTASIAVSDRDGEFFQMISRLSPPSGGWETVVFELDKANFQGNVWGGKKKNRIPDFPLRLQNVALSSASNSGTGSAALGKLRIHPVSAPIEPAIATGDELSLIFPGRENEAKLLFRNPGTQAKTARATFLLSDPDGQEIMRKAQELKLSGGETLAVPLPRPRQFGVYTMEIRMEGDGPLRHITRRYAYFDPAGLSPGGVKGFIFGICAHPQRYSAEDRRKMVRAAALCGAKLIRFALESERLEPRQGEWTFGVYDHIVRLCRENHMEPAPIFLNMPPWAVAREWRPVIGTDRQRGPRPDYRHWEDYVRKIAEHYRAGLHYAEIWNEPDLTGFANFPPAEYLELLKTASTVLRKTVPGITVISAGFATPDLNPPGHTADPDYVRKCVEGGRNFYDLFAVHMHSQPDRYRNHYIPGLMRFRRELKDDTPWYSNETALPSIGEISELNQAETLFRNLFCAWSSGAVGYNWYNLRNTQENPGDPEANYGMLTWDFQPKPVYVAYNTLTRCFREAKLMSNTGAFPVFRAKDGSWLIPFWGGNGSDGNHLLLFSNVHGKVSRIDLWGNEKPLTPDSGVVLLENSGTPAILRIADQAEPPAAGGDFLRFRSSLRLFPGRKQTLEYECGNPSSAPLKLDLSFRPVQGMAITPATRSVVIPPGGREKLSFEFLPEKGYRPRPLPFELAVGTHWRGTLNLQPESVIPIASGKFGGEPDLRLNRPEQIVSLVPVEGSFASRQWKGVKDLSANLWMAQNGRELLLRIVVLDDVHHQPYAGRDVWKGDNVQLGMKLPRQQGQWEFGFTHFSGTGPEVFLWYSPKGYDPVKTVKQIRLSTQRDEAGGRTVYEAVIPFRAIGLTPGIGKEGFKLNLLVNDNDGEGRDRCISAAPGMLSKDASHYPVFCF